MSYEVLLLMNRIKAEREKQKQRIWLKADTVLTEQECENAEEVIISDPCPIPNLSIFPKLRDLSVYSYQSANLLSDMDFRGLTALSVNVEPFSGRLKFHNDKLQSLRINISEYDKRLPLIDGNEQGIIDLSDMPCLVEVFIRHISSYTVHLPFIHSLKSICIHGPGNLDMNSLNENNHVVQLNLNDCNIGDTTFLCQFNDLEKLDLSYNRIEDASEIRNMIGLKELCIRKNPLLDPESYRLPQLEKVVITEKDYRINSFAEMIKGEPYSAFYWIHRLRDPDKIPPFVYNHYKDFTDEEIFIECLVRGIVSCANTYENPSWKSEIPLSRQETDSIILKQYPYLVDRIRKFREEIANGRWR